MHLLVVLVIRVMLGCVQTQGKEETEDELVLVEEGAAGLIYNVLDKCSLQQRFATSNGSSS